MQNGSALRWMAPGGLALVGACAITFPDFTPGGLGGAGGMGTGGAGGETSTSTSSSTSASSSSSSSGSSSSSASSSGGAGGGAPCEVTHPGGGTCEYLPGKECGCGPSQKCGVTDELTGKSACVNLGANPLPAWSKCVWDIDCAAGTWCDRWTQACKPICATGGDCAAGAQCWSADTLNGVGIPGLDVCTAHCDPETASPCGANLTCYYDPPRAEFDCTATAKLGAGAACSGLADCDKGLVCAGTGGNDTCLYWCHPADNNVSASCFSHLDSFDVCAPIGGIGPYDGSTYGACQPVP